MDLNQKDQLKEFKKLIKLNTNEAYKNYVKAQKNYSLALKKFIQQEITVNGEYNETYHQAAVFCLENQCLPYWAYFEDPSNEIKVFEEIISDYEFTLLNPEEFEGN